MNYLTFELLVFKIVIFFSRSSWETCWKRLKPSEGEERRNRGKGASIGRRDEDSSPASRRQGKKKRKKKHLISRNKKISCRKKKSIQPTIWQKNEQERRRSFVAVRSRNKLTSNP